MQHHCLPICNCKIHLISCPTHGILIAMNLHQNTQVQNLSLCDLPGPDTQVKREALLREDPRLKMMLSEAASSGWPKAYTDDLYRHDVERLSQYPETPMLWILRENGTHLYPLECDTAHEATYYREVIRYWSGDHKLNMANCDEDRARYYIVNCDRLLRVTSEDAAASLHARAAKGSVSTLQRGPDYGFSR